MTDLRALCARMADELDYYRQLLMDDRRATHALAAETRAALEATADCNYPSCVDDSPDERCSRWLVGDCPGPCNPERARAALAQPEPQGPTDEEPTDQEIEEWADAAAEVPLEEMDPEVHGWRRCFKSDEFSETIRAALARWGRPAIEPEPQGPTDEELDELAEEYLDWNADGIRGYARAVLARWGRPAIEPVPVSERLPGPEDTTDRNECWYWHPGEECWDMVPVVTGTLDEWTHWLPHWALPVPGVEGKP